MTTKKFILSTIFLSSILSSISMHAIDFPELRNKHPYFVAGEKGAIAFLGLSIFSLFYNEPKEKPDDNFDVETFKQPSLILSDPQLYGKNLYYFWRDRFRGQYFKDKYVKLKSDGSLKQSRKCPASGFLGNTFSVLIVSDKTQKMMKNLGKIAGTIAAYKTINSGWALFLFDQEQKATGLSHEDAKVLIAAGYDPVQVIAATDIKIPKSVTKKVAPPTSPAPSAPTATPEPETIH